MPLAGAEALRRTAADGRRADRRDAEEDGENAPKIEYDRFHGTGGLRPGPRRGFDLLLCHSAFRYADWRFDSHWRRSFCGMENHPAPAFHPATDCGCAGHGMVEIRPGEGSPACRREPHGAVVVSAAVPDWNECFFVG